MRASKYFLFLSIFLFSEYLSAQEDTNAILALITVDSWEKPKISGARIACTNLNTMEAKGTKTTNGLARLYLSFNTLYVIEVSYPGFYKKAIHVETTIGKKDILPNMTVNIEFLLKKNCENDSMEGTIMNEAMGRITYNKHNRQFEYDTRYTYRMENIYEDIRKKKCELAAKVRRAQKIAVEMGDSAKNTAKIAELKAELEQLAVEINKLEQGVREYYEKDLKDKNVASFSGKITASADTVTASDTTSSEDWKKVKPKFDEKKPYIFIFPRHGWPSELANYLQDSSYNAHSIGYFCYSLNEEKREIYIEDAAELREKFPAEFDKAFYNWDYIVNVNKRKE